VAGFRPGLGRGWTVQSFMMGDASFGVTAGEAEEGPDVALCSVAIVEREDRGRMVEAETGSRCGGEGGLGRATSIL